jgi:hypothetical protein
MHHYQEKKRFFGKQLIKAKQPHKTAFHHPFCIQLPKGSAQICSENNTSAQMY